MLIFFRKHYGGIDALWRLPIKGGYLSDLRLADALS